MDGLKTRRKFCKGTLTRLSSFSKTINSQTSIEILETKLERLEEVWVDFRKIQDDINNLIDDDNFDEQELEIEQFESKFSETKATLKAALKERVPAISATDSTNILQTLTQQQSTFLEHISKHCSTPINCANANEAKLPKVRIPEFDGNDREWLSFHDLFVNLVHDNNNLSAAQKFHYLKGFLKGEAAALLRHIIISDDNYLQAWERLKNRYNKRPFIVNTFIKTFLNLPSIKNVNYLGLRRLVDGSDEVMRGLKALGDKAESRDPWLVHLLLSKVDAETRQAWHNQIQDTEFPTVQQLIDFLNKRCSALEDCNPTNIKTTNTVKSLHTNSTGHCPLCKGEHFLHQCNTFMSFDRDKRRSFVKDNSLCFNCLRSGHLSNQCKSKHVCRQCKQHHHTLVHNVEHNRQSKETVQSNNLNRFSQPSINTANHSTIANQSTIANHSTIANQSTIVNHSTIANQSNTPSVIMHQSFRNKSSYSQALLPTAVVLVRDSQDRIQQCRLLLDSGSHVSFISENCVQRLGLRRSHSKISITGIASVASGETRGIVSLCMQSQYNSNRIDLQAFILKTITSILPNDLVHISSWEQLSSLQLADPEFFKPGKIDILLGADKLFNILLPDMRNQIVGGLVAQSTIFGWVIAGEISKSNVTNDSCSSHHAQVDIDQTLKRFWELEEVYVPSKVPVEDDQAEIHFSKTYRKDDDGRFIVELPLKEEPKELGHSLQQAIRRLQSMEKRFKSNQELRDSYTKFLKEYEVLGHMEKLSEPELSHCQESIFYLPHHAVFKQNSPITKLRVVFDASTKSSTGKSLNDILLIGLPLLRNLFSVFLRFRRHKYVLTSDIEKMFRQISVSTKHQNLQRIVWRESCDQPIQHYKLKTVTYGTASAPFLAVRSLRQLALDNMLVYPSACDVILNDIYMDDILCGRDSIEDLQILKDQLIHVLASAGFKLRKWSTNCWAVLQTLPESECEFSSLDLNIEPQSVAVLGIRWNPSSDQCFFNVNLPQYSQPTKRIILSEASRIFDPLGLLSPASVSMKILFQQLWLHNLDWDDEIPDKLEQRWSSIRSELKLLETLRIPRRLWLINEDIEFHGFADASEVAYAAVVYCRSRSPDGEFWTNLVAAKSKVAPLKQQSIPKLELCAALLLCRLWNIIKTSLKRDDIRLQAWTDSKIVLCWLSSHPRKWKTFVANRTAEILDILPRSCWQHIRSVDNPADCASRGILPSQLINHKLWWNGPIWLKQDKCHWPKLEQTVEVSELVEYERKQNLIETFHCNKSDEFWDHLLTKYSSWTKLLRVIAYCMRFIHNFRNKNHKTIGVLSATELKNAKTVCLKYVQYVHFKNEIIDLKAERPINSRSSLIKLTPFIDNDGLMRVGGRIEYSSLSFNAKHPVILPKHNAVTNLIILHAHVQYLHPGVTLLFSILRQEYWIIGCRNLLRKVTHNCIPCFRQRQAATTQLMGNLPADRITYSRPFTKVGVDYAGPLTLRHSRGRNPRYTKAYIAIFVCFVTKAMHLELVGDLTMEAFLAALRRFVSRRGKPKEIFSDNATNFKAAKTRLTELQLLVLSEAYNDAVKEMLALDGIDWRFIPPASPHFGGLWESGVKSVKQHLKRILLNAILTYEEMYTVLTQIEAILNSRPLCVMSDADLVPLTPAHFLICQPLTSLPEPDISSTPVSRLSNWQLLQNLQQGFWKRWHMEYLTSLQQRPKWQRKVENINTGDVVVLKEANIPPTKWLLGRIEGCFPGSDGLVRTVDVRTMKGTYRRAIQKIVPLPKSETDCFRAAGMFENQ